MNKSGSGQESDEVEQARDELLEELHRLRNELGHAPTSTELRELGVYSAQHYYSEFGGWKEALEAAEFDVASELKTIIGTVAEDQETVPTQSKVSSEGPYPSTWFRDWFGSWEEALDAAEIDRPSDEDLLEEIRALFDELGRTPTVTDLVERGTYSRYTYKRRFGSWDAALNAADLDFPTEDELLDEIRRLARTQATYPTIKNLYERGTYSKEEFEHHFDSWETAVEAALGTREQLLKELWRVAEDVRGVPTAADMVEQGKFRSKAYHDEFGSWERAVETAFIEENSKVEFAELTAFNHQLENLQQVADELGQPPTEEFVRNRTSLSVDSILNRFIDWEAVLRAAGLDPQRTDRDAESESVVDYIASLIERLTEKLDHRPNGAEIEEYIHKGCGLSPDSLVVEEIIVDYVSTRSYRWSEDEIVEQAFEVANIPESRDLTPSRSLTTQRNDVSEVEIPTHTDLLVELNLVRGRRGDNSIEEAFHERSVLEEAHYEAQFGSLSEAISYLESLDTRKFREPRQRPRTLPGPILVEAIEDLAEILNRRPLLEEVILFGDAELPDFVDSFETWSEVSDVVTPIESWTNEELLDELVRVGRELGRPPRLEEFRDIGSFPAVCYLRRFGSWPNALALVGVDTEDGVPEDYLSFEQTAELWSLTESLLQENFGCEDALLDELHRLRLELDAPPTASEISNYSPYKPERYDRIFGSLNAALRTARLDVDDWTSTQRTPSSDELLEELRLGSERSDRWLSPQRVCLVTEYSPGTYIGKFGSLESAFEAAGLSTGHFAGPTDSYGDVWHLDHQIKAGVLRGIQNLMEKNDDTPTMSQLQARAGISQNVVYRFFDSWDEAREAAKGITQTPTVTADAAEVENPEFVEDLLSEMSDMIDER